MEFGDIENYKDESVTAKYNRRQAISDIINGDDPLDLPSDDILYYYNFNRSAANSKLVKQKIIQRRKEMAKATHKYNSFANFQFGRGFSR